MHLRSHYDLVGKTHAFLSPSKPSWLGYDEDKLDRVYSSVKQAQRGTDLHNLAAELIRLGVRLPDTAKTMNAYVNDCIGWAMSPEQPLYFSDNCFGTADACGFKDNTLRISDLKTGVKEAAMTQLKIYAGLFCLEYRFKPLDIRMELRIYQNNKVFLEVPDPDEIYHIIDRIVALDKRLDELKSGA